MVVALWVNDIRLNSCLSIQISSKKHISLGLEITKCVIYSVLVLIEEAGGMTTSKGCVFRCLCKYPHPLKIRRMHWGYINKKKDWTASHGSVFECLCKYPHTFNRRRMS